MNDSFTSRQLILGNPILRSRSYLGGHADAQAAPGSIARSTFGVANAISHNGLMKSSTSVGLVGMNGSNHHQHGQQQQQTQNMDVSNQFQNYVYNLDLPNEYGIIEPGLYRCAGYPFSLKKNKKYFDALKLKSIIYLSQTFPNRDLRKYIHYKIQQSRKYLENIEKIKNNNNNKNNNKNDTQSKKNSNLTNTTAKANNLRKDSVSRNNPLFIFKHIGFSFFENKREWYSLNTETNANSIVINDKNNETGNDNFITIQNIMIFETLLFILNKNHMPCMIMCDNGRFETSLVIGCLRRLMNWNLTSIFREYYAFCKTYQRESDLQFIESFDCKQINFNKIYNNLPEWFIYYFYDCPRIENLELKRKILAKYKDRIDQYKDKNELSIIEGKTEKEKAKETHKYKETSIDSQNTNENEDSSQNNTTEQLAYHKYMYDLYNAPLVSDPKQFNKKLSLVKQDDD